MRHDHTLTTHHTSAFLMRRGQPIVVIGLLLAIVVSTSLGQEDTGLDDLDKATLAKLSAKSLGDLEDVSELCESALAKGLDEDNQVFARNLLKSTLYEQAAQLSQLIFDRQPPDPRWARIRQVCMEKLERALEVDADMGNAHLMVARLQSLPGGDSDLAKTSIEKAITALADEPEFLSVAYQTRATLTDDREQSLKDLDKAIELYPRNLAAWRSRGVYYLSGGQFDKALTDLQEILTRDPDDLLAHQAMAQTLRQLKQFDKAMEHLDQILESNPNSSLAYNLKARIEEEAGDIEAALKNLNEAVRVAPRDIGALLYRARLLTVKQQFDLAKIDVQQALRIRPQLPQAILLRSAIAASQGKYDEAIKDLEQILQLQPDSFEIKTQIATFYEADRQPRKAIELYDGIVADDSENWMAFRRRGDVYLSIGEQAKAIQDYEAAMAINAEDTGVLNNLAWVLSTSPHDELRDGTRAVDMAKKACELTEFKAAHILSTLASAYAELGSFEEAIKWSEKAVELNPEETQLANELESYRASKAWREEQNVEKDREASDAAAAGNEDSDATESAPVFDDLPDLDAEFDSVAP